MRPPPDSVLTMFPPDTTHRKEHWIDVGLWTLSASSVALTLWLSLDPVPAGAGMRLPGADKAFHGVAYFVTTLLLLYAGVWRPGRGPGPLARYALTLIAVIVGAGLLIELLQEMLTDKRELEFADWLADAAGALAAVIVHALVRRRGTEVQPGS